MVKIAQKTENSATRNIAGDIKGRGIFYQV